MCRAADQWVSTNCCQMFPGEAAVLALRGQCYRQCLYPLQGRVACLDLHHEFQETFPVWETVAATFCAVSCGWLSFDCLLMLSSAATALLPRSLVPV